MNALSRRRARAAISAPALFLAFFCGFLLSNCYDTTLQVRKFEQSSKAPENSNNLPGSNNTNNLIATGNTGNTGAKDDTAGLFDCIVEPTAEAGIPYSLTEPVFVLTRKPPTPDNPEPQYELELQNIPDADHVYSINVKKPCLRENDLNLKFESTNGALTSTNSTSRSVVAKSIVALGQFAAAAVSAATGGTVRVAEDSSDDSGVAVVYNSTDTTEPDKSLRAMLMADIETFKTVLKPDDLEAIGESDIKNGDLSLRDLETLQDSPDDPTMRKSFKQRLESFRTDRELKLRLHDVNTLEERYLYSYLAALRFLSDYQSRRKQYVVASKRMKADYSKIAGVPEAIPVLEKALKDCSADRATKAYADLLAAFRRELSSEEGSASMSIHERLGWDRDLVRLLVKVEGFVQKANHCLITAEDLNVSEIGLAQKVKLLDKIVDLRPDEWRYRHALYIDREIRIRIKDITQSKTPGREVDIGPLKAEIIKLKDEQALVVDAERERDQQKRIQKAIDQQFLPTDLNASVTLRDRLPALGDYAHARARLVDLQKIVANRITQLRPKKPAPRPGKTETIVPEYFLCDEKTEQLCQQEALKKMEDLRLEIEGLASRAEALDSQLSDTKGELAKIDPATTSASEKKKRSDLIEKQKKLEERLQKARKKLLELEAQKNPKYVIIIRRGYQ